MRVDLYFTPHQADEQALRERTVVVIDVLRASTSIATALRNGAREVIPVPTVESAVKISANLFGDITLLGGERNGRMIEGFHLGNSPLEYSEEKVRGKSIIFSTTNGSLAMAKARYAKEMVVCGFVNLSVVVNFLIQNPRDFVVVCAGSNGMFSLEDAVCAGMLLQKMFNGRPEGYELSDGAHAALALYKGFGKSIQKMVMNTEHGLYLQQIGFGDDLKVCAGVDTVPVLPLLDGNVIKLRRDVEKRDADQTPASS